MASLTVRGGSTQHKFEHAARGPYCAVSARLPILWLTGTFLAKTEEDKKHRGPKDPSFLVARTCAAQHGHLLHSVVFGK